MDTENEKAESRSTQRPPAKRPASESRTGSGGERPARRPATAERRPPSEETDDGARERRPARPAETAGRRRDELSAGEVARRAFEELRQLTTKDIEGVVGISRGEDGVWTVVLEVVESHHFPDSSDVMAEYSVSISPSGDLVGYKRGKRYLRGRPQSS